MATLPFALPANLKSIQPYLELANDYEEMDPCISYWCRLFALKQGFILKRVEEDLSFLLDLMEILGKNKQELQSKIEATDIPVARAHLEGVVQKLLIWAESAPPLVSFTNVVTKAFHSAGMLLDVCSIFGEPSEEQVEKKMYTDLKKQSETSESTAKKSNSQRQDVGKLSGNLVCEISGELRKDGVTKKNGSSSISTTTNDGGNATKGNGRKVYGRLFLLELRNHPLSQKRPENMPTLEIVRDNPQLGNLPPGNLSQLLVAPPPTAQPRESSGASRRARSIALRIVDPNTNRDILTGEEVPPSAVVTPTTATPPEIVATGVVPTPIPIRFCYFVQPTTATRQPQQQKLQH